MKETFVPGCIQACNTLEGQEHRFSSLKNHSSYRYMKIANKDEATMIPKGQNYVYNKKGGLRNRIVSKKPRCKDGGCTFKLSLFLSRKDNLWYLGWNTERQRDTISCCHTNHYPIHPSDLFVSNRKHLSEECHKVVEQHLLNGFNVQAIFKLVYIQFKINLLPSVVNNMRNQILNEMYFLMDIHETDQHSAAQKLVNLLKNADNVSYIFLKHHITSGFVTYTKEERKKVTLDSTTSKELDSWREELRLEETDEILVSCAWCHDDEKRKVNMFPEYLSFDTTFGLNRQRRSLFLAVGTDGSNKVFSAFRCWMPSKQKSAFYWTISQAMPFLFGKSLAGRHKVISSDSELSLVEAIKGAINSPNSHFSNAKFRSDYFHFFELKWKKLIGILNTSDSTFSREANIVKVWIKSWFRTVQTEEELGISYKELRSYLRRKENILGRTFTVEIQKVLNSVMASKNDLLHCAFMTKTSFGFLGSSIVEAMNYSIKNKGLFSIESNMNISHSTLCQLKQSENKTAKDNQALGNALNSTHRYVSVNIDQFLDKYMLDLTAKNFDARSLYYVRQKLDEHLSFWVMRKQIHDKDPHGTPNSPVTSFDRVYEVSIIGNFITCTCGYVHQYMCPCRHVLAVLSNEDCLVPPLFHYRWWKQFTYFYHRHFEDATTINDLNDKLKNWISFIKTNAFHSNGEYKGCYIDDERILKLQTAHNERDEVYQTMEKLLEYAIQHDQYRETVNCIYLLRMEVMK